MRCLVVVVIICLQLGLILASTSHKKSKDSSGQCGGGCTCNDGDGGSSAVTKQEGLAAAVGALTPLAVGGAGLGLYKLLKGAGPSLSGPDSAPGGPGISSPKLRTNRNSQGSFQTKGSPDPSYRSARRGSTPVSMFGEDDDLSFDESFRGRPDTTFSSTSAYTNVHKPRVDAVNRWM